MASATRLEIWDARPFLGSRAAALPLGPWQQPPQEEPDNHKTQHGEAGVGVCDECLLTRTITIAEIQR
jgi:hypothetical protein